MADRIQLRRDTAANWTSANPTLAQGEIGIELDTNKLKIGDGVTAWSSLAYYQTSSATGTVESVALSVPTGLEVSGSPITTTGTFTVTYAAGYSIPTTAKQSEWDTAYSWGNHADAGYLTDDSIGVTIQPYDAGTLTSSDIGVTVQAYDAATAKTDVAQNFTAPQRSEPATDNDLSFALSAKNNFTCTPTGAGTLTFTDIATTAGQSGFIKLVNTNDYAISAHADTIISTADLATISVTGTYLLSYFCDGTDVFVVASQDLTL